MLFNLELTPKQGKPQGSFVAQASRLSQYISPGQSTGSFSKFGSTLDVLSKEQPFVGSASLQGDLLIVSGALALRMLSAVGDQMVPFSRAKGSSSPANAPTN